MIIKVYEAVSAGAGPWFHVGLMSGEGEKEEEEEGGGGEGRTGTNRVKD